jgi:hypothetical protein
MGERSRRLNLRLLACLRLLLLLREEWQARDGCDDVEGKIMVL